MRKVTDKKPLVILVGPTSVGKTDISINIAKHINGEIISADSMQIYKYMDIGTAKIKEEEREGIKHYLIDELYPDEDFSVAEFQKLSTKYIEIILKKNNLPIVVGGTGLYINSLVYNLDFTKAVSNRELRNKYQSLAEKYGNNYIHNELKKVDPKSASRIHINDTKRIIRALEVYYETGKSISESYNFREPNNQYDLAFIALTMNRKNLYERINKRVDMMIENGLVEEVRKIINMGYESDSIALQGLGYKEIIKYLKGEYNLNEAISIIKRDTRRYAKRQLTWFRRDKRIKWFNVDEFQDKEELAQYIIKYIIFKLSPNKIFKDILNGGDYFEK